jgi:hypothetical protein
MSTNPGENGRRGIGSEEGEWRMVDAELRTQNLSQVRMTRSPLSVLSARFSVLRWGGEGGIRTHDTVASILPFQGSQFNRSCTSPEVNVFKIGKVREKYNSSSTAPILAEDVV